MKKLLITALLTVFVLIGFCTITAKAQEKTTLLFFWAEGCPHCAAESIYLSELQKTHTDIAIR